MKCQSCDKEDATVHLTDLINGEELHLCDKCAEQDGAVMPTLSVSSVIGGLIEQQATEGGGDELAGEVCPMCGMTYAQVRKQGKAGCFRCYEIFAKSIVPFVERIQGSSEHRGKAPRHIGRADIEVRHKSHELKEQLKIAVIEEDYELAATVRDQLRDLNATK